MAIDAKQVADKVRENRYRRMLRRRGFHLVKSRLRDPRAIGFGGFMIVDASANAVVAGQINSSGALNLDEVQAWLEDGLASRERRLSHLKHLVGGEFFKIADAILKTAALEDGFAHRITTMAQDAYRNANDGKQAEAAVVSAVRDCATAHAKAMAALLDILADEVVESAKWAQDWN